MVQQEAPTARRRSRTRLVLQGVLSLVLVELRIANVHLAQLTGLNFESEDVEGLI